MENQLEYLQAIAERLLARLNAGKIDVELFRRYHDSVMRLLAEHGERLAALEAEQAARDAWVAQHNAWFCAKAAELEDLQLCWELVQDAATQALQVLKDYPNLTAERADAAAFKIAEAIAYAADKQEEFKAMCDKAGIQPH